MYTKKILKNNCINFILIISFIFTLISYENSSFAAIPSICVNIFTKISNPFDDNWKRQVDRIFKTIIDFSPENRPLQDDTLDSFLAGGCVKNLFFSQRAYLHSRLIHEGGYRLRKKQLFLLHFIEGPFLYIFHPKKSFCAKQCYKISDQVLVFGLAKSGLSYMYGHKMKDPLNGDAISGWSKIIVDSLRQLISSGAIDEIFKTIFPEHLLEFYKALFLIPLENIADISIAGFNTFDASYLTTIPIHFILNMLVINKIQPFITMQIKNLLSHILISHIFFVSPFWLGFISVLSFLIANYIAIQFHGDIKYWLSNVCFPSPVNRPEFACNFCRMKESLFLIDIPITLTLKLSMFVESLNFLSWACDENQIILETDRVWLNNTYKDNSIPTLMKEAGYTKMHDYILYKKFHGWISVPGLCEEKPQKKVSIQYFKNSTFLFFDDIHRELRDASFSDFRLFCNN